MSPSPAAAEDFCSLEAKHDGRATKRAKLFLSRKRLQVQGLQHRKSLLGLSHGEDNFCSAESRHDRRTAPTTKLFRRGISFN